MYVYIFIIEFESVVLSPVTLVNTAIVIRSENAYPLKYKVLEVYNFNKEFKVFICLTSEQYSTQSISTELCLRDRLLFISGLFLMIKLHL